MYASLSFRLVSAVIEHEARSCREAALELMSTSVAERNDALKAIAEALVAHAEEIVEANKKVRAFVCVCVHMRVRVCVHIIYILYSSCIVYAGAIINCQSPPHVYRGGRCWCLIQCHN